jgi:hypothetical protein
MVPEIMLSSGACTPAIVTTANARTTPAGVAEEVIPAAAQIRPEEDRGDIVVTAQKRTQGVQHAPPPIQAVTARQPKVNAGRDVADPDRVTPPLLVRPAGSPVNGNIAICGIGTPDASGNVGNPLVLWGHGPRDVLRDVGVRRCAWS